MITAAQIRTMIQQLTLLEVSIDDFEEWLTSASWNMHRDSESDAIQMVGKIELLLSEMDAGHLSEASLLKDIGAMAGIFEMGEPPAVRIIADSSPTRSVPFNFQFELLEDADKRPAVVFSYTQLLPA